MSHEDDSFAALFEREAPGMKRAKALHVGDRVEGVVVRLGRDSVFVELDGRRQAFFKRSTSAPRRDLHRAGGRQGLARVVEIDEAKGVIRLGRSMGKPGSVAALEQAKAAGLGVDGKVTGVNKGGLDVEVGGARAFCPMSQVDARRVEDDDVKALIGQTLRFLVTDVRDGGKNVVVSRRALLQKEASENASIALRDVVPGAVLKGTVTAVRDFGAFVDLGGVEGLIPRSEIAHDRSVSVGDALKPGDSVEVSVREVKDAEGGRPGAPTKKISLSLKALMADPWAELALVEGRVVQGPVMRLTDFGAFVRLGPGVEGLLHVSEFGRGAKPGEGEEVLVVVKKIDRAAKKTGRVPAPDGAVPGGTVTMHAAIKVGAIVSGAWSASRPTASSSRSTARRRAGRGLVPVAGDRRPARHRSAQVPPRGHEGDREGARDGEGKLRLSIKGAAADEERADFEAARARRRRPRSLGTFADLLKKRKP